MVLFKNVFVADTATICTGVRIGEHSFVGEYVLLGERPPGAEGRQCVLGPRSMVRSHTVIYFGNQIGSGFQTGHHVFLRESNTIGDDVSVGTGTVLEHHITIGDRVRIHSQAFIPEYCVLEDECWLGPRAVLTNARYPASPEAKKGLTGVTIKRRARIGANVTVLPGITIGEEALVGAGAVVVRDVPPKSVVVGNPAHPINTVDHLPYL